MASVTLAEAAKLTQNMLVAGVIENIITVNQIFNVLPFEQISGNALAYNRELALGGAAFTPVGGSQAIPAGAKTAATFTPVTSVIRPIIGDANVDHFIQSTMSDHTDQKAVQVASKAKSIGRKFQDTMVNGDTVGDANSWDGMKKLIPAGRKIATTEVAYDFDVLDALISMITAKDGQVDFFMMNDVLIRKHFAKLRALGGATINDVITLPGGGQVPAYRGVPLFRNDWVAITDEGAGVVHSSIYAGTFDDGSRKVGIAGLTSEVNSGVFVTEVGEAEGSNDTITRVRFYCGMAIFSELGIAMAEKITAD